MSASVVTEKVMVSHLCKGCAFADIGCSCNVVIIAFTANIITCFSQHTSALHGYNQLFGV